MENVDDKFWNYINRIRGKGKTPMDGYENLLEGLKDQKEKGGIGSGHYLYEILKEVALLKSREKLSVLRSIQQQVIKKQNDGIMMLFSDEIRKFIYDVSAEVINCDNIDILNSFSGTGALLDYFTLNCKGANFTSEEIDEGRAKLQRLLFHLCDINVDVEQGNSLAEVSSEEEYDIIIGHPPFNNQDVERAFMSKSLERIKDGGIIIGIISQGILFNHKSQKTRDKILKYGQVLSIIEIPNNVFFNTSVNAAILIIRKKDSSNPKQPRNVLMASIEKTDINSLDFEKQIKELKKEWKRYVEEDLQCLLSG